MDSAVRAGHEAVTTIRTLSSKQAHARLRTLADIAAPTATRSEVTDLRERIRDALTTAA